MSRPLKRGEAKARHILAKLDAAGVVAEPARDTDGNWGVRFPDWDSFTDEQQAVAHDAKLFALGYPGCFRTMVRLIRERGASPC